MAICKKEIALIGTLFNAASAGSAEKVEGNRKRTAPAPFSIRLSPADRIRLTDEAAGTPLGAYIRAKVFSAALPAGSRRKGLSVEDRKALAQALALLGASHLISNLNQLAHAANSGTLLVSVEVEAALLAARQEVGNIRRLLIAALGLKAEDAS